MRARKVLAVDVGGTHVKVLASGVGARREFASGPSMTPAGMVKAIRAITADWMYQAVSIGYPGVVVHGAVVAEPRNLGPGWVNFDFRKAFGVPVKVINDAAMQALGSYEGGRLFFLGLGTGLGSAMIVDGEVEPMELGHLTYKKGRTYEEYLGDRGLERLGKKKWRKQVMAVIETFRAALEPDSIVIGGGNARKLVEKGALPTLPKGVRLGDNANAFVGGFRLWLPR
jgi:polyphosphate glucokinase